jgi:hypothetical protein
MCHYHDEVYFLKCSMLFPLLLLLLLLLLTAMECHSLAKFLTLVKTKQIRINIHKRNNTKNRVNTSTQYTVPVHSTQYTVPVHSTSTRSYSYAKEITSFYATRKSVFSIITRLLVGRFLVRTPSGSKPASCSVVKGFFSGRGIYTTRGVNLATLFSVEVKN